MEKSFEYEAKKLINESEFDTIINNEKINTIIDQTNYYFETNDTYFKNNEMALRIRTINNTYELTLKIKQSNRNIELNKSITKEEANDLFDLNTNNILLEYEEYIPTNIKLDTISKIHTIRYIIDFDNHIVELDKTTFDDTFIDYEIEIESSSIELANSLILNFCKKHNIIPQQSYSKIKRYFMYKKK